MHLREILGEKLKPGGFYLVDVPSLSGKDLFAHQFFYERLDAGDYMIYITTSNFADNIIEDMIKKGWDIENYKKKYAFIDAYSAQSNPTIEDKPNISYVPSITEIVTLTGAITSCRTKLLTKEIEKQPSLTIIFDSTDELLMNVPFQDVYRFLRYLKADIMKSKISSVFIIDSSLHEEKIVKKIYQIADVLIRINDKKKLLDINLPDATKRTLEYRITKKGFEFFELKKAKGKSKKRRMIELWRKKLKVK